MHKWQSESYNDKEDIPQGIIHEWIKKDASGLPFGNEDE
jgi:hypothetical protein